LMKKYDMKKDLSGIWTLTTDSIGEGIHYYNLLIDGVAVADPASETFYGMGRMVSAIEIPSRNGEFYALKDVPHGDIRIKHYFSKVTFDWRSMYVYTPPGDDTDTQESGPVLYLLHDGGEAQRGWSNQGRANFNLDNLIAKEKAEPMITVMVDGNFAGMDSLRTSLELFENELIQSVIPFVEQSFRVKADANRSEERRVGKESRARRWPRDNAHEEK